MVLMRKEEGGGEAVGDKDDEEWGIGFVCGMGDGGGGGIGAL